MDESCLPTVCITACTVSAREVVPRPCDQERVRGKSSALYNESDMLLPTATDDG